jgi:hypothetical protein
MYCVKCEENVATVPACAQCGEVNHLMQYSAHAPEQNPASNLDDVLLLRKAFIAASIWIFLEKQALFQ